MILRWLLNHLIFAGTTFFAAGAGSLGGGATTGSPGATGGAIGGETGGSGSGTAITDTSGATGDKGGSEGTTEGTEDGASEAGGEDFGEFEDFGADDETTANLQESSKEEFGPETYQQLKKALQAQPELFKSVKKAVSMVKRFQEHFETPEAASELLTDLQTHGGWDTVKQELGETATFLSGFNAGDKEVVSRWLDENSDGLAKNMPAILDKWIATDKAGWAHDAAQTFMATMNNAPVGGISALAALNQLATIEGVKDSEAYKTVIEAIKNVEKIANTAPVKQATVPDTSKLSEREKQIKQGEENLRRQALAGKASPILDTSAKNALKIVAGTRKLGPQAQKDLISDIHREFAVLMEKDGEGKKKRQALMQAGQTEQWLKMVKSAAERTMPLAARRVWRKYAGISGISTQEKQKRTQEGQQRRETGAGGATQGLQSLSPGDGRQVDWDAMRAKFGGRDKADEIFAFGLKNFHGGKRVWIQKGSGAVYTY